MNSTGKFHLPLLIIISVLAHFPFVLTGIGEPDSARIASVIIDTVRHGSGGPLAQYYFTDTIPLYISYLTLVMKFLNYDYSYLPAVMNYTNAVFATLVIVPAFLLVRRLFDNSTVAFCSVLLLIFAPTFFLSSIYGAPHLISFFFFFLSIYLFLLWTDSEDLKTGYLLLGVSALSLTITILFKVAYILGGGFYLGILYLRRVKDIKKISISLVSLMLAIGLFVFIRRLIMGPVGGDTSSIGGFMNFFSFFTFSPSLDLFIRQVKPLILVPGLLTTVIGIISIAYFLYRKRFDVLIFLMSWAALTNIFFLLIFNNSRHFMLGIFPLIVTVVMFFHQKAARLTVVLTGLLILCNFFIFPPSDSTYFPSGNIFNSGRLLEKRNTLYHLKAMEILNLNEDKIVVLGYFHNPYVMYELLRAYPSAEVNKIGREDYSVIANNKEYMLIYIGSKETDEWIDSTLDKYNLHNHVVVSVTNDLKWLERKGVKIRNLGTLPGYHSNAVL